MQPKIIKFDSDYKEAVAAVEKLMDLAPEEGTAEREQFELLTLLVQEYESRIFKRKTPSAIEAILFRMEQDGLSDAAALLDIDDSPPLHRHPALHQINRGLRELPGFDDALHQP